jgi:hypothetical protein
MEPSFALPLADMAARSRLGRAYSALPDAPVRPYRPRRRILSWPARAVRMTDR